MSIYQLFEDENFSIDAISSDMFGANYVTSFDHEFVAGTDELELLTQLGVKVLRFPGGSITETVFTEASFITSSWDVRTHIDGEGNSTTLTTLGDFIEAASIVGADVQLVIPTRVAFAQSAGQALFQGTFGERNVLDERYFKMLDAYIDEAISEANTYGVNVIRFEIGNEFWGSGEMSASEYGFVAATITEYLSTNFPAVDVTAQIVSSANQFSPLGQRTVFLEPDGNGDYVIHSIQPDHPIEFVEGTIPGSGNAVTQTESIAEQFLLNPYAASQLDGIVEHVYFDAGLDGIDHQRDFSLNFPHQVFTSTLGLPDIDFYITEWSPRNPLWSADIFNRGDANGLHYAHTVTEAFFELTSNGVDGANFWPLTFGNPSIDSRVLVDTSELDLTFGGAIFQLLSEFTTGLVPVLDYEVSGVIDVHGFEARNVFTMFVSERGGNSLEIQTLEIGLNEFLPSNDYFMNISILNSDDDLFEEIFSSPSTTIRGGSVHSGNTVELSLSAWDVVAVKIQAISDGNDIIFGTVKNDQIWGLRGADRLFGNGGNDRLKGGAGNDALFGGAGLDKLRGSGGDDRLKGGVGDDKLRGGTGSDILLGGNGDDKLVGGKHEDVLMGGVGQDKLAGGHGNDALFGGAGRDKLRGCGGDDRLKGGVSDDKLRGGTGSDILFGGNGDDTLVGGRGNDRLVGGSGNDKFMGGKGADIFIFKQGHGGGQILDFELGTDFIKISEGASDFSDIRILDYGGNSHIILEFDHILVENTRAHELTADHFIF